MIETIQKWSGVVALLAILLTWLVPAPTQQLVGGANCNGGNCTDYDAVNVSAGYYVGDVQIINGSGFVSGPSTGTCSLIAPSFTIAASSSTAVDCAVTGVVSGDIVFAQFATSSSNGAGWLVTQASASSTSGYITLRIVNNTGASALIPASLASSTQYFVSK